MIQLHQFLVYVLKYLAEDDQITNDCSEYITLRRKFHSRKCSQFLSRFSFTF